MKMQSLRSIMLYIMASVIAGTVASCGQTSQKQKIEAKLKFGRHTAGSLPTSDRGLSLGLTNSSKFSQDIRARVVDAKANPNSRETTWINFNPTTQPKIAEQDLLNHALGLPAELNSLLHISSSDLNPMGKSIALSDSLKSISFQRTYQGLTPVRDAYFEAIYLKGDDGFFSLRQINNNTHGAINVLGGAAPVVSIDMLEGQLPFEQISVIDSRQIVYPELLEPGTYQFVMATELTIGTSQKDQVYTITAENGTARVLEAYSNRLHAAKPIVAKVYKRNYKETEPFTKPIPELEITFGGQKSTTNIDGIADPGAATTASVLLMGSRFTVVNNTATVPISLNVTINGSNPDHYIVEPDAAGRTAINAYTTLVEINRFAMQFLPKEKTPYLSYNLPVFINVPSEACNAFFSSTPTSPLGFMALGLENAQCSNMALVNDVPYHEWGHGLDNALGVGITAGNGITDGTFSEGIGDIISTYFTDSPDMAVGFFLANNNSIRSANNMSRYPMLQNQVHTDGLIIAGSFWDMRKNLIATHGKTKGAYIASNLFFNHLLNTDTYLQSYQNVLLLDDNDGNPATKSPNFCAINAAFAKHGLATLETCSDLPESVMRDDTLVIATQKQEANGVTLMAATALPGTESIVACVGTRSQCDKDPTLPRSTLLPEGSLGERITFLTSSPIPVKAQDIVTLYAKKKDGETIGSRMFKYVSK